jgi:hypothetical protein
VASVTVPVGDGRDHRVRPGRSRLDGILVREARSVMRCSALRCDQGDPGATAARRRPLRGVGGHQQSQDPVVVRVADPGLASHGTVT